MAHAHVALLGTPMEPTKRPDPLVDAGERPAAEIEAAPPEGDAGARRRTRRHVRYR
jgi:hypothetical protein